MEHLLADSAEPESTSTPERARRESELMRSVNRTIRNLQGHEPSIPWTPGVAAS